MPDVTPLLGLPYILPSQAQKHVTHNEALAILDVVAQLSVLARNLAVPPTSPAEGDCYIVASGGVSEWGGHDGKVAVWQNAAWNFLPPRAGWQALDLATTELVIFDGNTWAAPAVDMSNIDGIGIGTTWDSINRLSVAADATLLTHDGAGHQLKINKAFSSDAASLLFQTGWSGRAEMGIVGNDRFAIKTSADGVAWVEALSFDSATGVADGAAVQQNAMDMTAGRLMRADFGYSPANILGPVATLNGAPSGAVMERGSNANGEYVRFADGTQVCTRQITFPNAATPAGALYDSGELDWVFPASFVSTDALHVGCDAQTSDPVFAKGRATGTGTAKVRAFAAQQIVAAFTGSALAVGRWY